MVDRKPWQLYIYPLRYPPVDDSALDGLVFVRDHETSEAAQEEGLRVLDRLRECGGGNDWGVACYLPKPVANGVQIEVVRFFSPEGNG